MFVSAPRRPVRTVATTTTMKTSRCCRTVVVGPRRSEQLLILLPVSGGVRRHAAGVRRRGDPPAGVLRSCRPLRSVPQRPAAVHHQQDGESPQLVPPRLGSGSAARIVTDSSSCFKKSSCTVADRSFSVGTIAEILQALVSAPGGRALAGRLSNRLLPVLVAGVKDGNAEVRNNGVFGLGCLAEAAGPIIVSYPPQSPK